MLKSAFKKFHLPPGTRTQISRKRSRRPNKPNNCLPSLGNHQEYTLSITPNSSLSTKGQFPLEFSDGQTRKLITKNMSRCPSASRPVGPLWFADDLEWTSVQEWETWKSKGWSSCVHRCWPNVRVKGSRLDMRFWEETTRKMKANGLRNCQPLPSRSTCWLGGFWFQLLMLSVTGPKSRGLSRIKA